MTFIENTKKHYQALLNKDLGYNYSNQLTAAWLNTSLGEMLAIADDKALYLLEFLTCKNLDRKIEQLKIKTQSIIAFGCNKAHSGLKAAVSREILHSQNPTSLKLRRVLRPSSRY